jgi:hypothetical protein
LLSLNIQKQNQLIMPRTSKIEKEMNGLEAVYQVQRIAKFILSAAKKTGQTPSEIATKAGLYADFMLSKKGGKK